MILVDPKWHYMYPQKREAEESWWTRGEGNVTTEEMSGGMRPWAKESAAIEARRGNGKTVL